MKLHYQYLLNGFSTDAFSTTNRILGWGAIFKVATTIKDPIKIIWIKRDLSTLGIDIERDNDSYFITHDHDTNHKIHMTFNLTRKFLKAYRRNTGAKISLFDLILLNQIEMALNVSDDYIENFAIQNRLDEPETEEYPMVDECHYHDPKLRMYYWPEMMKLTCDKNEKYIKFNWSGSTDEFGNNVHRDIEFLGGSSKDYFIFKYDESKFIAIKSSDIAQKLVKCCIDDTIKARAICNEIKKYFDSDN